ncbi:MAG: PqqD family protein [Ruminococcaceae bacterium]|nr:PqqD family protein [Oscillospiraceae bacterium]
MKLKNGFILRDIGGECVAVPTGSDIDLNGMITLNETAKTLWLCLEKGAELSDLVKALTDEYEVDEETARKAAVSFTEKLKGHGFLE